MDIEHLRNKLDNYRQALARLREATDEPNPNETGCGAEKYKKQERII